MRQLWGNVLPFALMSFGLMSYGALWIIPMPQNVLLGLAVGMVPIAAVLAGVTIAVIRWNL